MFQGLSLPSSSGINVMTVMFCSHNVFIHSHSLADLKAYYRGHSGQISQWCSVPGQTMWEKVGGINQFGITIHVACFSPSL
jgi:hypothetical protein